MSEAARGWAWTVVREQKLAENERTNDGMCEDQSYGCLGIATEVHHVVARINGGTHNDELLALCSACHQRHTTQLIQERAAAKREAKREARRRNHPGRKDRYKEDYE